MGNKIFVVYYSTHKLSGVTVPFLTRSKLELENYINWIFENVIKPVVYITIYNEELLIVKEHTLKEYKKGDLEWLR